MRHCQQDAGPLQVTDASSAIGGALRNGLRDRATSRAPSDESPTVVSPQIDESPTVVSPQIAVDESPTVVSPQIAVDT